MPGDHSAGDVNIDRALEAGLVFRPLTKTVSDTSQWLQTKPQPQTDGLAGLMDSGTEDELLTAWAARDQER